MSENTESVRHSRRNFVKGLAALGGVATVAAVADLATAEADLPPASSPGTDLSSTGYHETPHIRDYYEKARF